MDRLKNPILMAAIGAPHGLRGELRVKTYTGDPLALGDYGPLRSGDGRAFTVAALRPGKNVVIVRFAEVHDRTAAEALSGTELFVERDALPADLEEDEFYHADLIGLEARDAAGTVLGRIAAIHDFGGGDIIELRRPAGQSAMIPFTRDAVPSIDVEAGIVVVDAVAAGLEDLPEPKRSDPAT